MTVCAIPTCKKMIYLLQRKELCRIMSEMRRFYLSTIKIREFLWLKIRMDYVKRHLHFCYPIGILISKEPLGSNKKGR